MRVEDRFPQEKTVASYCPPKTTYSRHACGLWSEQWKGIGRVQNGPFHQSALLGMESLHCNKCNCDSVTVECIENDVIENVVKGTNIQLELNFL